MKNNKKTAKKDNVNFIDALRLNIPNNTPANVIDIESFTRVQFSRPTNVSFQAHRRAMETEECNRFTESIISRALDITDLDLFEGESSKKKSKKR